MKRLVAAIIAVFVFLFFFEWVYFGILMKEVSAEVPGLMRTQEELGSRFFHWLVLGQLFLAVFIVLLHAAGFSRRGLAGGLHLGGLLAGFALATGLISYAVHPMSENQLLWWSVGAMIELFVAGLIAGAIFRPAVTRADAPPPAR